MYSTAAENPVSDYLCKTIYMCNIDEDLYLKLSHMK